MNRDWLLEHADYPIKYILTRDGSYLDRALENDEVKYWLGRLTGRALGSVHGSHDYRYENIAGKCFILGLNSEIPQFDAAMRFFINFLDGHITKTYGDELTFDKMYGYRDYETIMACYMPFLGYAGEKSVRYVAEKRANIIYGFTRQNRYDVYRDDLAYPGANKAWKPYILDPELYRDGNIAFPSVHDLILFAGMYPYFDRETKERVETTVKWIFDERYASINNSLYYYAPDDPRYKTKHINGKVPLFDFDDPNPDPGDVQSIVYRCFIYSHFREARKSKWFARALAYLDGYKQPTGRYIFPKGMTVEKADCYVHGGGHMNVGESKKTKNYAEIISTYWMERILSNLEGSI